MIEKASLCKGGWRANARLEGCRLEPPSFREPFPCNNPPVLACGQSSPPYTGEPWVCMIEKVSLCKGDPCLCMLLFRMNGCLLYQMINIRAYAVKILIDLIIRDAYYGESILFQKSGTCRVSLLPIPFIML